MQSALKNRTARRPIVCIGLLAVFLIFLAIPALALDVGIEPVNEAIELGGTDIRVIIGRVIQVVLGLLGAIAVIIVLWGGFQWMTAGGDPEKILAARRTLINGAIGLAIVLSSFAITTFILNRLIEATTGIGPPTARRRAPPALVFCTNCSALGGIIESHYPPRDAEGIPRNTNIMITFNDPILLTSIIRGWNDAGTPDDPSDDPTELNTDAVSVSYRIVGAGGATEAVTLSGSDFAVRFTPDRQNFVLDPIEHLGSSSQEFTYTVSLPGEGIRIDDGTAGGRRAFTGQGEENGYSWIFHTSTILDRTPPIVDNYYPRPPRRPGDDPRYPRNTLIQVHFNEPIDPTTVTARGVMSAANRGAGGAQVAGKWRPANNYRSAEFIPDEECGTNACGETMFCLPPDSDIDALILTAELRNPDDSASSEGIWPTGILDAAGNALNNLGENDDVGGRRTEDNVAFDFSTSSELDITPPFFTAIRPEGSQTGELGNVPADAEVSFVWTEIMSLSSLTSRSVRLLPVPWHPQWFIIESEPYVTGGGAVLPRTITSIRHSAFVRRPITEPVGQGYVPSVNSGARDAAQNCYVPSAGPGCTPTPERPYCCNGAAQAEPVCAGVSISP